MSYRIKTNLEDKSQITQTTVAVKSGTSIPTPKGKDGVALLFEKGQDRKIIATCGYPSVNYPAIQDAIDANKVAPLYLVCPAGTGKKYGGVFLTPTGTVPFLASNGLDAIDSIDFASIPVSEQIAIGDGTTTVFNLTLGYKDYYENNSIDIEVDGVSQAVTSTDAEPEVLSTVGGDSGSLTRATGVLEFTFDTAPAVGEVISGVYTADLSSDAYMAIVSQSAQDDDVAIVAEGLGSGQFTTSFYRKDAVTGDYSEFTTSPYTLSMTVGDTNGYGQNIYAEDVLTDDDYYLKAFVNADATYSTFVDDTDEVDFEGGLRGTITDQNIADGYDIFTDTNTYDMKVLFDPTGYTEVATKFVLLRGTDASAGDLLYTKFLLVGEDLAYTSISADFDAYKNAIDNRGINYFAGSWGIHVDGYKSSNFNCSNMGLITGKYLQSQLDSKGALSPSWVDENGIGGLLGSNIVSLNRSFTQTQLKTLQANGINGIEKHPTYGMMIEADRTTQVAVLSDYSYTIHSDLADNIIKLVAQNVLPLQINKPNDVSHRTQVALSAGTIINSVSEYLRESAIVCNGTNNTDDVLEQRKFVLTIGVKYTPNSQWIDFNFVNSPQGLTVEQTLGLA